MLSSCFILIFPVFHSRSIKSAKSGGLISGGPPHSFTSVTTSDEGASSNTRSSIIAAGRSSYSPIYASYASSSSSSYRRPTAISASLDHPSSSLAAPTNNTPGNPTALYGSLTPSTTNQQKAQQQSSSSTAATSVDYSVVSAQSQDKDVLRYYKSRQASGSSQTGVAPSPITVASAALLNTAAAQSAIGEATMASDIASAAAAEAAVAASSMQSEQPSAPTHQQHQQSTTLSRSHHLHQAHHHHHLLPEDQYGSTTASTANNQQYSSNSNAAATAAIASIELYGTTGRAGKSLANTTAADIYGTVGRKSAASAVGTSAASNAANGHTLSGGSHSFYGTDAASVMAAAAAASSTSAYGLPPHLLQQQQQQLPSARPYSMNLGLLHLSGNHLAATSSTAGTFSPGGPSHTHPPPPPPPLYEQHLAAQLHLADNLHNLYGPPGSSKTLPSKKHGSTLLAISAAAANPRASYKDG